MDFTSTAFYAYLDQQKLMGVRCQSCHTLHLPPRPHCPYCHSDAMEWIEFSGRGKLVAFTHIYIAPTHMLEAGYGRDKPYCAGIVQLEEGPSISAQILGVDASQPDRVAVGTPLKAAFVHRGENQHLFLAFEVQEAWLPPRS